MEIILNSESFISYEDRLVFHDKFNYEGENYGVFIDYIDINREEVVHSKSYLSNMVNYINGIQSAYGLCLLKEQKSNLRKYPIFNSRLTLHTMIDRIDDANIFKKWLFKRS